MEKGLSGHPIGRTEKASLLFLILYIGLYYANASFVLVWLSGIVAFVLALVSLFRLARRSLRDAIWRLRNRLIAAYLFIAVVPVVLILTLVALTGNTVIGQMAVYLVNTELRHRETNLLRLAEALARVPAVDPERAMSRTAFLTRNVFPDFELAVNGSRELHIPDGSTLKQPPREWKRTSGLIVKDGKLCVWAHVPLETEEVTIVAPLSHEILSELVPGLGDVTFIQLMEHAPQSYLPQPKNALDFHVRGWYPMVVAGWNSPESQNGTVLVVETRISAVLGTVFQKTGLQRIDWPEFALGIFISVAVLFLVVELFSLLAGIQLSRSITGSVHELYEGTQRVKEGDFAYRIPVKGTDQLAELGSSFNTMTENLGRLVIVTKEKERLESELEIAREVQNQLFPKDTPIMKTLELKGVCNPARMVSGDYYDFMSLTEHSLGFAIGDVAGKGISAALLMATIQSTMRTQLSSTNGNGPPHFSTAKLVANLNRQLYANTAPEKYATFYLALFNECLGELTYTNAGHLSPLLIHDGSMVELASTGTVVGAFPIAKYTEKTVKMEPGDVLVAYTDGIVEPENAYGEMFGDDQLKELLFKYCKESSTEIIARTMEAVHQWTGAGELQDDMTMVVARRL